MIMRVAWLDLAALPGVALALLPIVLRRRPVREPLHLPIIPPRLRAGRRRTVSSV
jgi:hypothetical protein